MHQRIPNDISSAAFFIVAALLLKDSDITLTDVGLNPTRLGVVELLKKMGGNIDVQLKEDIYEPSGDICVKFSQLQAIDVTSEDIPFVIDELPVLMIAAACANGRSSIRGAHELRYKETDRIHAMAQGLRTLGVSVDEFEDGIEIEGKVDFIGPNNLEEINSFHDHRVAMSFAVLGLRCKKGVSIISPECANISYPNFYQTLQSFTTS